VSVGALNNVLPCSDTDCVNMTNSALGSKPI
jgi:hypothetical protein